MIPGVFRDITLMRRHQRDRLGNVERGAPADTNDRIRAVLMKCKRSRSNLARGGIAPHAAEDYWVKSTQFEIAREFGETAKLGGLGRRQTLTLMARKYGKSTREIYAAVERAKRVGQTT